jgi:cell division protein ZapA
MGEARQLLFASLLLADELKEQRAGNAPATAEVDASVADALERLADRIESLAARLESEAASA